MARPLRIEYPGALYHITSRGNARADIFDDNPDREKFLTILGGVVRKYRWICHGYCLMDNHYHLLVETPESNLCRGMRQINGLYTQGFNRRHGRIGHLFQGRYREKESGLAMQHQTKERGQQGKGGQVLQCNIDWLYSF